MLKNRYFIFGLGLGFVLCGILLVIYGGTFITDKYTELTIEEIKVLAEEKGLYIYTGEELDDLTNDSNNKVDKENVITDDDNKLINFNIPYGLDSNKIADHLFEIGILEDKRTFMKILEENHLTKGIYAGDYEYNSNITVRELIELITKTKIID